jgi:DEAD/DEAH box helicase domain-containing protein
VRELLEQLLAGTPADETPLRHVETLTERAGRTAPWPAWVPPQLRAVLAERGVAAPWTHQAEAAELAWSGSSVVVATGTASGKSLCYQVPGLSALAEDAHARVLYLAPTKALAGDQLAALRSFDLAFLRAATYDGDTAYDERDWVRAHANWVLSNPDMLHRGILPQHQRWASFLRRLRFVVLDECHAYRGVFGSHVAQVIRRLRRICAGYGSQPVFVLASATSAAPAESATRLVGTPVAAVVDDGSPRGAVTFALWEPPFTGLGGENGAPVRRSAGAEAGRLLADLVGEGARTLAFVRSRRGAELTALGARRQLLDAGRPELGERVAAYRAGYLPEERRALEADLSSGRLLGVAATNALELGMDIAGLDAVVLAGFPGTIASLWQQAGRAGRRGTPALAVFVARDDPLDTYLAHHPEALFGRPVEATVCDPTNVFVLAPQLCCAAVERPIRSDELASFGTGPADVPLVRDVLDALSARGVLRARPAGWFWTGRDRPDVDLRGSGAPIAVVEKASGSLIGTVDSGSAPSSVHPGAVYLHQSRTYVVDELDLAGGAALVHAESPPWTTSPRDVTDIAVVHSVRSWQRGPLSVHVGTVDVTNQVVGYVRRHLGTGEFLDETPLDLPPRQLRTAATWYVLSQDALDSVGLPITAVPGAAHAAEHAAIGLLPLFATCDRWDIGGVSTALHPDTGEPTVFVYDGHAGGAGFAARGFEQFGPWLSATRSAVASCECRNGCPSCVQSPKCGNGNEPLDKAGAVTLLELVLRHVEH